MLRKAYLLLLVLVLIPYISHAETKIIYETNKYVMGDNDSKNDARRMCFLEAKRKVLEKAGTYIESHTQVKNYKLKKDEINSYSAALLKVETVKEEWKFVGENMAIFMSVKAEVDTSYIEKQLAKITKDTSVQKKIKDQQRQLQELERKFLELQRQLGKANSSKALQLRKEKKQVFKEIDVIEERYKYILSKLKERKKAQKDKEIESVNTVRRFINNIEIGMTLEEVIYIFGEPDGITKPSKSSILTSTTPIYPYRCRYMYYGNIKVETRLFVGEDDQYSVNSLLYELPLKYCGTKFSTDPFISKPNSIILKSKNYNILLAKEVKTNIVDSYANECIPYIMKNILGESTNMEFVLQKR